MSRTDALPCELFDQILCHAGPIACAHDRALVAAVRIQRRWRRTRLAHGMRVLYRYLWMRRWDVGTVYDDGEAGLTLRASRRVVFDVDRRAVRLIPLSA